MAVLLEENEVITAEISRFTFYGPRYRLCEAPVSLLIVKTPPLYSMGIYDVNGSKWHLMSFGLDDITSGTVQFWACQPPIGGGQELASGGIVMVKQELTIVNPKEELPIATKRVIVQAHPYYSAGYYDTESGRWRLEGFEDYDITNDHVQWWAYWPVVQGNT